MTSSITSSYTTIESVPEDPDTPKPAPTDDGEAEVKDRPIPRPRSKLKHDSAESNQNNADAPNDETTNEPGPSSESDKPPSPKESPYVFATEPLAPANILKKIEAKRSVSLPKPVRPPPPSVYYGSSSVPKSTSMPCVNEDEQESITSSASSSQQSPVSPGPGCDGEGVLFGIYSSMPEDSEKPAVPPRPPQPKQPYVSSASLTSKSRPPPPAFSPPPLPSETHPQYNYIKYPDYLHILPEHDNETSLQRSTSNSRSSTKSSTLACTQETMDMLKWLKIVSKTNYMPPSLYGASLEEEIRSFHETALNLKKALRLFNLLMMKRSEVMRDHISELTSISDAMDKALKKKKTIQVAGGTTGAVGGVTAVVGIALAPVTFGASLIATAVGAGMVASAGGVSAHVAKNKKKLVTRDGIERQISDYTYSVKDIEYCLNFILCGMNELRRYDIARLQRAGAQLDAVKIAHLTQSVFNNMDNFRRNTAAQAGGMSSERLLQGFTKELDYYFTEKNGQKLKKSRKSRFSGRVRLLAENLQDELDYLNHMWELFN